MPRLVARHPCFFIFAFVFVYVTLTYIKDELPPTKRNPSFSWAFAAPPNSSSSVEQPKGEGPVFLFETPGRLGNCLNTYATALAYSLKYPKGYFIISELAYERITSFLRKDSLTLSFLGKRTANEVSSLMDVRHPDYLRGDMNSHIGPAIEKAIEDSVIRMKQKIIAFEGYSVDMSILHKFEPEIRREFQIRPELLSSANEILREEKMRRPGNVTFVGVHIRLTDYVAFSKNYLGVSTNIKAYLEKALEFYRKLHPSPLFVICSDDKKYARDMLSFHDDVFFPPSATDVEDAAILASCADSIVTQGSFGFWASFLAGGRILAPSYLKYRNHPFMSEHNFKNFYLNHFHKIRVE